MSQVAFLPAGKREQTKVLNRLAILDAAREVFAELGYDNVTVRDIIRRTGLAAGTFYNYFKSKEEVFVALSSEGAARFAPILKSLREQSTDFENFVRAAINAYFGFLALEHANWLDRRPAGEQQLHVYGSTPEMTAVFDEVRAAILEEAARGGPVADPDFLAGACIGVAREVGGRMLERRPIDTEAAVEFTVTMLLSGLKGLPKAKA